MNFLTKNRSSIAQSVFFVAHLFLVTSLCASEKNNTFFTAPLTTRFQRGNVKFVKDAHGKEFVVKYPCSTKHAIQDALGAQIGESVGININSVKIFPYDPSSTNQNSHEVTTLHTVVPGKENTENTYIYGGLRDQDNLKSLTYHKDLCKIAALDIYLDNWDRHNGNLFFDEKKNKYHAIDMDRTLESHRFYGIRPNLLSNQALDFIKNLDKNTLSQAEENALKKVNKTLHKLTSSYPPKTLQNKRTQLAKEVHHEYSKLEQQKFNELTEYNFQKIKNLQNILSHLHEPIYSPTSVHYILKHIAKPSKTAQNSFWETMHS
ncbi:MAG TPA: hypothetical protein VHX42_01585 [Candidatus Babeliales bacterium]|jgi:hypothetical protein|nr:hypothetical protein [Candidatus Babeliales bacterium]